MEEDVCSLLLLWLLELGACLGVVDCCSFWAASLEGRLARDCRDADLSSSGGLLRFSLLSVLAALFFCLSSERRVTGPAVGVSSLPLVLFVCPLLVVLCGDALLLLLALLGPENTGSGTDDTQRMFAVWVCWYEGTHCPNVTKQTCTLTFRRGSRWFFRFIFRPQFLRLRMAFGLTTLPLRFTRRTLFGLLLLPLISRPSHSQFQWLSQTSSRHIGRLLPQARGRTGATHKAVRRGYYSENTALA